MKQDLDSRYTDLGELLQIIQDRGLELPALDLGTFGRDTVRFRGGDVGLFYGSGGADTIVGNRGDDVFAGGTKNDIIGGRFGNDVILGGLGGDTLRGHAGNDELHGGAGRDLLLGGAGNDILFGDAGNDRLRGGTGNDTIEAGTGRNFVNGGAGEDTFVLDGLGSDYTYTVRGARVVIAAQDRTERHIVSNVETILDSAGNVVDAGETVTLQLLHASDLEGNADAVERAPNFATIVDALRGEYDTTLVLSSGDNFIPSPFSNAAGSSDPAVRAQLEAVLTEVMAGITGDTGMNLESERGRFDIAIMNAIGFDASAIGNHEFDFGQAQLASNVGASENWTGALFPYLSANLEFEPESILRPLVDGDGIDVGEDGAGTIAPFTIIEENGAQFGVIGLTTPLLTTISSTFGDPDNPNDDVNSPPSSDDMAAVAEIIQPIVDALENQGVNKIILTSHLQQFALENELATLLDGVDIYLAGGSDTIVADGTDRLEDGDEAAATYPVLAKDAGGNDVAIMSTDGQYSYVGRLVAEFDAGGHLVTSSIDEAVSGAYVTDEEGVLDVTGAGTLDEAIDASPAGSAVRALTETIADSVLVTSGQNYFADLAVDLDGERQPGVRTEETNLGNLTADANLAYARELSGEDVLVSIKNGGGIRASISADDGLVSELDIQQALAFNNNLSLVTATPQELVALLEHGVGASSYDADGLPTDAQGRFPQVGGLSFSFDPTRPEGARVWDVTLLGAAPDGSDVKILEDGVFTAAADDFAGGIRIVTLDFMASGGDGYPFDTLVAPDRVDLADDQIITDGLAQFTNVGTEQDALAEYLAESWGVDDDPSNDLAIADTPAEFDMRIVNLAVPGVIDTDL